MKSFYVSETNGNRCKRQARFLSLVILAFLVGCAGQLGTESPLKNEPRTWKFRHPPSVIQKAATQTLEKKGFKIKVNDADAGLIETKYLQLRNIRDRVILRLKKAEVGFTAVTCHILREKKSLLSSNWEPDDKVDFRFYRDLKSDIEFFIYRTIYDKY